MEIAILDDEKTQLQLIEQALIGGGNVEQVWGEEVNCHLFDSGLKLLEALKNHQNFDIIFLDRQLPDMSGDVVLQWLRQYRKQYVPVIMLTSLRNEEQIVESLEAGADDYVTKPFRPRELLARSQRLIRQNRHLATAVGSKSVTENTNLGLSENELSLSQTIAGYHFEPFDLKVVFNNKTVALTEREFRVAFLFFTHLNAILPRETIFKTVWKRDDVQNSRALDTHIYRIRGKLDLMPENGFVLRSIYGYGYRLENLDVKSNEVVTL